MYISPCGSPPRIGISGFGLRWLQYKTLLPQFRGISSILNKGDGMSEDKTVVARYNRTVPNLLKEAGIYRRKCNQCKGTGKIDGVVIEGKACFCACSRCEGDGFRYSMSREKQSPSFARITVANMAKRSIEPYLNSLKPSVLGRVKGELEKEIDGMIESFEWVARS